MSRKRSFDVGRVTSNKNEAMMAILMRGEDKRRKLVHSYLLQSDQDSLSVGVGQQLWLANGGYGAYFPPDISFTDKDILPGGGSYNGGDETAGGGDGLTELPNYTTPDYTKPDTGFQLEEVGKHPKPDHPTIINEGDDAPLEMPTLGGEHTHGDLEEIDSLPPPPPISQEEVQVIQEPPPRPVQGDVKVQKVKNPDGTDSFYAYNDSTNLWYLIKFINPTSENDPHKFLMDGMLYVFDQNESAWFHYNPAGSTGVAIYIPDFEFFNNGTRIVFTDPATGKQICLWKQNANGLFIYNNVLYSLDEGNKSLIPVNSTEGDTARQTILWQLVASYGLRATQFFMLNNYSEYFYAWRTIFPSTPPITQEMKDQYLEVMMSVQWYMISTGPESLTNLLQPGSHPDLTIAYSLLFPNTPELEANLDQILNLNKQYLSMSYLDKIQFQKSFEMSWAFEQPAVKEWFDVNLKDQMAAYIAAMTKSKQTNDPDDLNAAHEAWQNMILYTFQLFGASANPYAALFTGIYYNLGINFISLQLVRIYAMGAYGINLSVTYAGILQQTLTEVADILKTAGKNRVPITMQSIASETSLGKLASNLSIDILDGLKFAYNVITKASSSIKAFSEAAPSLITGVSEAIGSDVGASYMADAARPPPPEGAAYEWIDPSEIDYVLNAEESAAEAAAETIADVTAIDVAGETSTGLLFASDVLSAFGTFLGAISDIGLVIGAVYTIYELAQATYQWIQNEHAKEKFEKLKTEISGFVWAIHAYQSYLDQGLIPKDTSPIFQSLQSYTDFDKWIVWNVDDI